MRIAGITETKDNQDGNSVVKRKNAEDIIVKEKVDTVSISEDAKTLFE